MIARGRVTGVRNGLLEVAMPPVRAGGGIRVETVPSPRHGSIRAFENNRAYVAISGRHDGVAVGTPVRTDDRVDALPLGTCVLGRAIDASGIALDDGPPVAGPIAPIFAEAPFPDERRAIAQPLWTGIRAIDALLTFGRGARVGLFGAPGVGKSTLLEMMVRGVRADVVVVGLVGERGREAQAWIDRCDRRTTVVCATSDRAPSERYRCAHVAIAQARALARRGLHVLVILDSLARFGSAARELALAAGENVGRGGYPPSVFAEIARLVEQCGAFTSGSITLLASVLCDGDANDPVSEAARSMLDGHIALESRLADAGRYPAIDVCASTSRTMPLVADSLHRTSAASVRGALALLDRAADARTLGIEAFDPETRAAIAAEPAIERLLRQAEPAAAPAETLSILAATADRLKEPHGYSD